MPRDQGRQTEIAARILRDFDDPMFRLALRVQEEALRAEPQWVAWSRVRQHGVDDDVAAYFRSKWHRLASPADSQPTAASVHMLKTLCGRNVPGDARRTRPRRRSPHGTARSISAGRVPDSNLGGLA